ncbi:MAG: hypothetical protein NZM31_05875 [Gemmatales bacterium]|nr:hypothetical protein [Gemmatales bacterium]MDW8386527.1 hypothetical protein [Gemmatales bacterium]
MPEDLSLLLKKVRQVRRRLIFQAILRLLPWTLAGAVLGTALWHFVQRRFGLYPDWTIMLPVSIVLALLGTLAAVLLRLPSRGYSALSLDEAFGLRERVTTALMLSEEQRSSPAGVALMEDLRQRITQLDVASRFPVRVPRVAWLIPAAAVLLGLAVHFYNPTITSASSRTTGKVAEAKKDDTVNAALQELRQQIAQRRKRLGDFRSEQFQELETDLDRLLEKAENAENDADRQAAIEELTRLAAEAAARQKELAKLSSIQQQLRNNSDLKDKQDGPAKDFQEALSKGDIEEARKQLEELAQKIKEGKLSEEDKQKLAEQLRNLKEKLEELAELKKRREAIARSNLDPETKRKELAKLDREAQKLQDLAKLAQQLSRCEQCLARDDGANAAKALEDAQKTLEELALDAKEAAELEAALQDMEKLKECLGCKDPRAGGGGSEEDDVEPPEEEIDNPTEKPGTDRATRGGRRGERATDTDSKNERARSPLDPKGKILFQGYGPQQVKPDRNSIGKTTVDIGPELVETRQQATEALRQQKVPPQQRDLVSEFYKNLIEQGQKKPTK